MFFLVFTRYSIFGNNLRDKIIIIPAFIIYCFLLGNIHKQKLKAILINLLYIMCIAITLFVFFRMYMTENNIYEQEHHYSAFVSSVLAVLHGRTPLVDYNSQYGMYAYLLAPVFRIVPFNLQSFSIVMIILQAVAFLCNYLSLRLLIKNKLLRLLAYFNIVYFGGFYFFTTIALANQPYYQMFPHRYLFPSIIIYLFIRFTKDYFSLEQANKKIHRVCFALLIAASAFGIIWNFDTGIVSFGAGAVGLAFFAFCASFSEIINYKDKVLYWRNFIVYIIAVPISIILFILSVTLIRTGSIVIDISDVFMYQQLFYRYGFFALPMPLIHPWMYLALVYFIGISLSAIYTIRMVIEKDIIDKSYGYLLFLSVIGVGLFSYYQGRSHHWNFISVTSSSFYVIALLVERMNIFFPKAYDEKKSNLKSHSLLNLIKEQKLANTGIGLIIVFLLFFQPISLLFNLNSVVVATERRLEDFNDRTESDWVESVLPFIEYDEEIIILAYNKEAYISSRLNRTNAILNTSYIELLSMETYAQFSKDLHSNSDKKVFVELNLFDVYLNVTYVGTLLESEKYNVLWYNDEFVLLEPVEVSY